MNEPTVIVNGQRLSDGEVMTIRVALNSLISDVQQPDTLGVDEHGKVMASLYQKCAQSTLVKMSNPN